MRYKVGDSVRYIKYAIYHTPIVKENSIWKIIKVDAKNRMYFTLDETNHKEWFKEEELQKVEYTYEELKKSPIGTKVTFEDGDVLIKIEEDQYYNNDEDEYFRNNENLKGLKDNINLGKIIKIEEPEYQTVYESKPEILDEVEKRYLRGVIRPFKENVRFITKRRYWIDSTEYNDISICIRNNSNIILPKFIANKMYKGMEMEKTYTLEELGL